MCRQHEAGGHGDRAVGVGWLAENWQSTGTNGST